MKVILGKSMEVILGKSYEFSDGLVVVPEEVFWDTFLCCVIKGTIGCPKGAKITLTKYSLLFEAK